MKIEYTCEICGKKFTTESEAIACEKKHDAEKRKNGLKEASQNAINKMFNQHIKSFGEMPEIHIDPENIDTVIPKAYNTLKDILKDFGL